jgi:Domain of unknown function (DUF4129)
MKCFLIMTAVFLTLAAPAAAQEPTAAVPPQSPAMKKYFAELDRWSAAAKTLKDHPGQAAGFREVLPPAWPLEVQGQRFIVPTAWLRKDLESVQKDPKQAASVSADIQQRLDAMRSEAMEYDGQSSINPALAKARLKEVLARGEFRQVHTPGWFEELNDRIAAWFDNLLERLLSGLGRHAEYGRWVLWFIVISLVMLFLILLSRTFFKGRENTALDLKGPLVTTRGWKDWARDALGMAARGDYREAIRLGYWAGIYRLEELGVWRAHRARTHREYLRLLGSGDVHRPPLAELTSRFESVWYGGKAADRSDFEDVIQQLEKLGCSISWRPATGTS